MTGKDTKHSRGKYLGALGAWAFAFGCAVGWDAFLMPESLLLPKAGPVGTMLALLFSGMAMAVVAWNYHVMINRYPGSGGAYAYASEEFGRDHGYVCAWFLCLFYISLAWMDATIIAMIAQYAFGAAMQFGFTYNVSGNEVHFGNVLMSVCAIGIAAVACCRRRISTRVQTVVALVFALGIIASFSIALSNHSGGAATLGTCFMPGEGSAFSQVLGLLAVTPWMFIGFETMSNISGDFAFPLKKTFAIMACALGAAVLAYIAIVSLPVLRPPEGCESWLDIMRTPAEHRGFVTLDAVKNSAGALGIGVVVTTLVCAIFTNLIGNTVAASRLVASMASDGALPRWLAGKNHDGAPRNAVVAIAVVSVIASILGMSAISVIVDVAVIGAVIAYAYTSAATWRFARRTGSRISQVTGAFGVLFAVTLSILFVTPAFSEHNTMMSKESYLAIVIWSMAGLISFFAVFRRERGSRFGHSSIVWVFMLSVILFMSMMWVRQRTYDATEEIFEEIAREHGDKCWPGDAQDGAPAAGRDGRALLMARRADVNRSIFGNSIVQFFLTALAFVLTLGLYATLRRREREMEKEKAMAKSYFFSTVSHDIRTPLNAILGFSEMLRAGIDTEAERNQALDAILLSGKTLLGLINDVLDLSKLESGKMSIMPEPMDCPKALHELVDAIRVASHKKGIELRCVVGEMPPLMLDPQRIRQIVFNLVGNAIKFTEKGYVELRAAFERDPKSTAGEFHIEVEDTGCGISEEDKKYIGKAYVQVGSKVSRNGGTGLGLTICNQLAAAMGGHMRFTSELGKGSRFSLIIPSVRVATTDDYHNQPGASADEAMPKRARHAAFKIHRVLIVDDSNMNIMVLKAFFHHIGNFDVVSASDGREALKILTAPDTAPFDLVLTDLWMPNLDGKGLAAEIRKDSRLASLLVVAVTADVELRDTIESGDFNGILFKPVTCEKLCETLDEMERRLSSIA